MKKFNVLFTDLDGTLIRSFHGIYQALRVAFAKVGQRVPSENAIDEMFGLPVEKMLTTLTDVRDDDLDLIEEFVKEYKRQYPIFMADTPLIENAFETIRDIHISGVPICLITSERRQNVLYVLKAVGLSPYIREMVARDDVIHFKPHPESLLRGLSIMGADAENSLYIGESPYDIEAGLASGIFTVAVASGGYSRECLLECKPNLFINDISELRDFFI